jgi:branched-subunit amino acid transport protein
VSTPWLVILGVGAGTVLLKGLAPAALGGRELPSRLTGVMALLAPTLLAALVVTNTFASGRHLVLDPRAAGLAAALVAVALRAPVLVVILVSAVTAGGLRAIT